MIARLPWPEGWPAKLWLAVLVLLPFLALGSSPLFDLDEGAFTSSTTEMFLRGDFLSSYMLGEPRHDKPILIYWLQAVAISLLGHNEFAFRLPSALASGMWILLTYLFVAGVLRREAGLIAALIIATAAGLSVISRAATADALLNLFLAASGYATWLWLKEGQDRWRYLGFAAMGLCFLTKGPIAVLVPAGTAFLWCLSQKDVLKFFRWGLHWRAIALFLVIAAPWFIVETWLEGPDFLRGFFLKHNLSRFDTPMEGHGGNYFYYLPVVLISLLPHTGLLLAALGRLGSLWRDPLLRFGLIWFCLVLGVFSFSGTKLPHYVYYGYGGLVLILAQTAIGSCNRWLLTLPAVALLGLLVAAPELLTHALPTMKADDQHLATALPEIFDLAYRLPLAALLAVALALPFSPWRQTTRLHVAGLFAAIAVAVLLMPALGKLLQTPVKQAGLIARDMSGPLVLYASHTPSFQTYAQRQVRRGLPVSGDIVLTRESKLATLAAYDVLYRERSYLLLRMR
jgi:4-amino-4-deoxy-L-arabinose transferase-like glycosyltransferase